MSTDPIVTIAISLLVSVLGMLLTNAMSSGWRAQKITQPLQESLTSLRESVSNHVGGLHEKIDSRTHDLQLRVDDGMRVIDDKLVDHFKDDVVNFGRQSRETGEVGHSLREKIREVELWNRDHYLQVKYFDDKIDQLTQLLSSQDRVADARHSATLISVTENRTALSEVTARLDRALNDLSSRLDRIENGKH